MLRQYDEVLPGAAKRILDMAEAQHNHRIAMEKADSKRANMGLWVGVSIAFTFLAASVYLITIGHTWAGVTIAGLDIVGLVSVFVYGTSIRRGGQARRPPHPN